MLEKKLFGRMGNKAIYAYILRDSDLEVTVLDYGATVADIKLSGRRLAIGYDDLNGYLTTDNYFGATVGRVANRIAGGRFMLDGKEYQLDRNNGNNYLHGGFNGYDKRIFRGEIKGETLFLTLVSEDGDQGFGGELCLTVAYTVKDSALSVEYTASCDRDTLWAPTNHTFFNLSGSDLPVGTHELWINAEKFTPVDRDLLPTGELRAVKGTPFDFSVMKPIGRDVVAKDEQIAFANGGYDHNFVLDGEHAATLRYGGIMLDVYTDMPGLQLYTANFLAGVEARGLVFNRFSAVCLEPQYFPDAINRPDFESPVLKAGERKKHYIRYKFQ